MKTGQTLDAVFVSALSELIDKRAGRILDWVMENERLLPGASDLIADLHEIITRNSMIKSLSELTLAAPKKADQLEFVL